MKQTRAAGVRTAAPLRPQVAPPASPAASLSPPAYGIELTDRGLASAGRDLVTRSRGAGARLEPALRSQLEAALEAPLGGVTIHTGAGADAAARALGARAFAIDNEVFFRSGAYAPGDRDGRRLIAHEVAHTVQSRGGTAIAAGDPVLGRPGDAPEREADSFAAEFVRDGDLRRSSAARTAKAPRLRPIAASVSPQSIHLQSGAEQAALRARLQQVQARLAQLRAQTARSTDRFVDSVAGERQRESAQRITETTDTQIRQDRAAHGLWGSFVTADSVRRSVTASQSGNVVTLAVNLQLTYLALRPDAARARATSDMPRIEAAIRDAWQVDIQQGAYAGVQFRMQPSVSFLPRGTPRASNAFLIEVRGVDRDPSAGEAVTGTISLAQAHLDGDRVRVVAHELAHLFGFLDTYLLPAEPARGARRGARRPMAAVGRSDAADRADLLGLIDPVVLARLQREGAITAQDVARQTAPVHVWEDEASQVLRTLDVAPPQPPRPTPDSDDFDPDVELDRIRREGDARLQPLRERRRRAEESIEWLDQVEEIMRLEREEGELQRQLSSTP